MEVEVADKEELEMIRETIFDNYRPIDETFDLILSCGDLQCMEFIQQAWDHKFPYYWFLGITDIDKCESEKQGSLLKFLSRATLNKIEQLELKTSTGNKVGITGFAEGLYSALKNTNDEAHLQGLSLSNTELEQIFKNSSMLDTLKLMNWQLKITNEFVKTDLADQPKLLDSETEFKIETLFLSGSLQTNRCACSFWVQSQTESSDPEPLDLQQNEKVVEITTENCAYNTLNILVERLAQTQLKVSLKEVKVDETDLDANLVTDMFTQHGFDVAVEHW